MVTRTGPISRAVRKTLDGITLQPADSAAAALTKRYAALIDEAAPAAKYRDPLTKLAAALDPDDETAAEALQKIRTALSEHTVASDLGPKLLAALTALGATPASRKAEGGGKGGSPVASELDKFRERRAKRSG
jgi:hypothetical protein